MRNFTLGCALLMSPVCCAAVNRVRPAPFDFAVAPRVQGKRGLIARVLHWVDGGGDLSWRRADGTGRGADNYSRTKAVRLKWHF